MKDKGFPWECPVCGFTAQNKDEQDQHINQTGHVIFNDTEDKGTETPGQPSDLEYSQHSGYTPGVSSGDVRDEKPDIASHNRVLQKKKPKK